MPTKKGTFSIHICFNIAHHIFPLAYQLISTYSMSPLHLKIASNTPNFLPNPSLAKDTKARS